MSDCSTGLRLPADLEKPFGFGHGRLVGGIFALGSEQAVISLDNSDHQASRGNLGLGPGHGLQRAGTPEIAHLAVGQHLVNTPLTDVFVYAVISNETCSRRSVALGIKILSVVTNTGQQARSRLDLILMSDTLVSQSCLEIDAGLSGQRQRVLQGQGLRRL